MKRLGTIQALKNCAISQRAGMDKNGPVIILDSQTLLLVRRILEEGSIYLITWIVHPLTL